MTFKILTLGCKVNTYESNVMKDALINEGFYEVANNADIYIINTCTVTNTADNKSMKLIRRTRKENENSIIVVCGCMVQNKKVNIDEADIVIGNIGKSKIADYIKEYIKNKTKKFNIEDITDVPFESMVLNNFNKTRAFVKIQDGCNNFCTYCIIPYVRGNVRCKNKEDVINEIKALVNNGHKEIVLTGIHTGNYKFDDYDFASLLNDIVKIESLERLRISSIEVTELNDRVLDVIKNNKILVDHMHIPLQSGSNTVLKRMNRKYDKEYFINKIEKIRSIRPSISITTDVIVGFPGETIEEFNETIDTIKKVNFSKLHVFPYSKRDGTKAALMDNQIDDITKKERAKKLIELSQQLENNYMNKFINKEVIFIPEVYKDGFIIGHTGNYLSIKSTGKKEDIGIPIRVKILKNDYPYMIGQIKDTI